MHFESLPKVVHHEDAIREYEREESKKIAKWLTRFALLLLPIILVTFWILLR